VGRNGSSPIRVASFGHALFAAILIAIGIVGLVTRDFGVIWSGVPKATPARAAIAWLCAFVCIGCGIGILLRRTALLAARVLFLFLVAWMLAFRVPLLFTMRGAPAAWWVCGETAVVMAGAWVLCVWFGARSRLAFATGDSGVRIAGMLYGLALIPFGVAHFTFLERTVGLVPGWLPWHTAWAYFTGGAFVAAGIALVLGVFAPLAATLSTIEMGLFTVIVWVPIVVRGTDAANWNEFVDSVAMTAGGWLVADACVRSLRTSFGLSRSARSISLSSAAK